MNPHDTTRANYDRLSRWYDWFAGSEKHYAETGLRLLDLKPGAHVLEIGCGTGHALRWLSDAGARAVGLDLSAGMLARARQAVSRRRREHAEQLEEWVELCQGDALHLPFKSSSINAVFLSFTLELFPESDIPLLLAECRRVLRWDGRLGVVALAKENTRMAQLYEWFHARWPQVVDCRPIYVHAVLIRAGFEIREARRMVLWGLPVEVVTATPS
ncbi:MAG: methyltransferase domain-containing protein [Chloroflexi bacterium]|nr:methyltransferase domain-containing protein [Chloroflexota bacterium]